MKKIIILVGCIVFVSLVWLIGGTAFQWSLRPFAGMFGDVSDLENIFAPVGTFFSALAAGATFFLIFWQFEEAKRREKEFKKQQFESIFFQLINIHRDNVKNISYCEILAEEACGDSSNKSVVYEGQSAFCKFYEVFWFCCWHISNKDGMISDKISTIKLSSEWGRHIDEGSQGEELTCDVVLKTAEKILHMGIKENLNLYYHNLYTILKCVDSEVENINERKRYIRILRAQISTYEYAMIYYHASIHRDENNEHKFKQLIETTGFLHNMDQQYIFDYSEEGNINSNRYSPDAFACNMK